MTQIIKTFFFSAFFLLIAFSCFAQSGIRDIEEDEDTEFTRSPGVLRLGVTPSALLNQYVGIQMNAALDITDNIQFNMEAGVITSSATFNAISTKGFRFRPALRWYVTDGAETRFHLSVAYNIRNTKAKRVSSFSFQNGTTSDVTYEQERKVRGPAFLFGLDYWISKHIVLDMGVGIGAGKIDIRDNGAPQNGNRIFDLFSNDSPGTHNYPIMIFNIRFQYVF
jgi:hypothetical protein